MEELNLSHKKNGETLDCSEWNKLVSVINYIIDFYNEYPTKLSEFENDSNFISVNNIVQIIQELIDNGTLPSTLGIDGKSAYEIAVEKGYIGTELLWLNSLKGAVGESAYQIAVNNGFIGTQQLWINSLKGNTGQDGAPGKSAYLSYVDTTEDNPILTEELWVSSLLGLNGVNGTNGLDGADGKSAYQSYVETTNDSPIKTEALWIASLKGADGTNGTNGIDGQNGSNGLDGVTPHIDPTTKHWMIGETDTGVLAEGVNGQNGTNGVNGQDGVTPHIDSTTGNWFIGNTDTGVKAYGFSGSYNDLTDKPGGLIANGHDYVEIGGIKWATMNVGANSITDIGFYFQWGDTQGYTIEQVGSGSGKKYFGWEDYKYSWESGTIMIKYLSSLNITELEAIDDAVQAAWGGSWRMPTIEEFLILSENTYVAYESNYLNSGISGLLLTDKKDSDKQLFFPYTGYAREGNMYSVDQGSEGEGGYYWSKSRYIYDDVYAHYSYLNYSRPNWYNKNSRKAGFAIRGVIDGFDEFHKVAFTGNYNDLNNRPYTFNENSHTYVDLGLPSGTMWATMNVGALSETDYGNYYKYGRGSNNFQTDADYYTYYDGTEDPLSINFDTASQVWGGDWHMPTKELLEELVANTTYTWETNFKNSGINGGKFRSRNGNYIFFPAAGYYDYNNNGNLEQVGVLGGIWSSSPRINAGAYGFYYGSGEKGVSNTWRMNGLSVRPVLNRLYNFSKSAFTGNYNDLSNKPTIPAAQIQVDWNQTDNTAPDYIKNKPTIPASSGTSTLIQADWDLSDNTALDYIKNKPTIPAAQVLSDWNATTGMGVILNKPTIPAAQVQSDWNATTGLGAILNKPTIPTVPANETATNGGNTLSVVTTGDKYNWNNKASIWSGTQSQYDALSPNYDSNTIYIITASS